MKPYLTPSAFTANLTGWERVGAAEFDCDRLVIHDGLASARIRIPVGAALAYQQIRRDFREDVRPGDEVRASVWVRSEGVDQDPGAYLALEILTTDGSRAAIFHSRTSQDNGARGWELLEASGQVPADGVRIRMSLILHAHGTAWFAGPALVRTSRPEPWPDLGDRPRQVVVDTERVSQRRFGGVGFHAFHHVFPATNDELNEVIYKRWRELNPSFVRLNDHWDYDRTTMEQIASHMRRMKETGTEIYLTSWNPPDVAAGEPMKAWARRVADNLEYYTKQQGLTNIRYYCMTNELSLGRWGALVNDLPRFRDYHRTLHEELQRRGLKVGLLATDASPASYWHTVQWAAENMDEITSIYGGHHYFNEHAPEDERFYPWFLDKLDVVVKVARTKGKDFILGEFGARQDGRTVNGVRLDRCVYFETPTEPLVAIQLAEAVIAALNAGVYGVGYWTYMDFPDDYRPDYVNKWGTFRCSGQDRSTRAIYYAYGLLTRYFRGPARSFRVTSDDPRLRVAAVRHARAGTWSIAVVNRSASTVPVSLRIVRGPSARFRKYVYDPAAVRHNPFGDLPRPTAQVRMVGATLSDRVGPMTLTVYTTAYDEEPPPAVRDVRVETAATGVRVAWRPSRAKDTCYYRVYRLTDHQREQIRSTIATAIVDPAGSKTQRYAVTAVDLSGNESQPTTST